MIVKLIILFNTVRHLRFGQIFYRLKYKVIRPRTPKKLSYEMASTPISWVQPEIMNQSVFPGFKFRFLGVEADFESGVIWNSEKYSKLWLYNLHYFDDLNAANSSARYQLHHDLVRSWISDNQIFSGNGWEPYTLSLRIVNWIKWVSKNRINDVQINTSILLQSLALKERIEYHLLGNHLFVNAKALIFSGCFFGDGDQNPFLRIGLKILDREIPEQILPDGGHFELSPMYHNIILVDLLDLINLALNSSNTYLLARVDQWKEAASRMLRWMQIMSHPDGEIAFFNDSAFQVSPPIEKISQYAYLLSIEPSAVEPAADGEVLRIIVLPDSGYISVDGPSFKALLDCARIGPDFLPGHAHADTLSFELSVGSSRLLVNSGTSCYGLGEERLRQRSTPAHNTVEIDGQNSSEVWGGFRVARRAYPSLVKVGANYVVCSHNGFQRLRANLVHERTWNFTNLSCEVIDVISGNFETAKSHFHLHPDVVVHRDEHGIKLIMPNQKCVEVSVEGGGLEIANTTWHPEFGKDIPTKKLVVDFVDNRCKVKFIWN